MVPCLLALSLSARAGSLSPELFPQPLRTDAPPLDDLAAWELRLADAERGLRLARSGRLVARAGGGLLLGGLVIAAGGVVNNNWDQYDVGIITGAVGYFSATMVGPAVSELGVIRTERSLGQSMSPSSILSVACLAASLPTAGLTGLGALAANNVSIYRNEQTVSSVRAALDQERRVELRLIPTRSGLALAGTF